MKETKEDLQRLRKSLIHNLKLKDTNEDWKQKVERIKMMDALLTKEQKWWERVDPNVALTSITSVFGILAILNYEKADILTSKALGFVKRS